MIKVFFYLRNKYQGHAKKAAEYDRQRDKGERRVLLARDHQRHRRRDEAQHHHVVNAHAHVAGVVDLPHLHRPRLVRQEQPKHEDQPLVTVHDTYNKNQSSKPLPNFRGLY